MWITYSKNKTHKKVDESESFLNTIFDWWAGNTLQLVASLFLNTGDKQMQHEGKKLSLTLRQNTVRV